MPFHAAALVWGPEASARLASLAALWSEQTQCETPSAIKRDAALLGVARVPATTAEKHHDRRHHMVSSSAAAAAAAATTHPNIDTQHTQRRELNTRRCIYPPSTQHRSRPRQFSAKLAPKGISLPPSWPGVSAVLWAPSAFTPHKELRDGGHHNTRQAGEVHGAGVVGGGRKSGQEAGPNLSVVSKGANSALASDTHRAVGAVNTGGLQVHRGARAVLTTGANKSKRWRSPDRLVTFSMSATNGHHHSLTLPPAVRLLHPAPLTNCFPSHSMSVTHPPVWR